MAELDYAFLANFAKVHRDGTLTAVGASFTHVTVSGFPTAHRMSVAGRIRSTVGEGDVSVRIVVTAPDEAYRIGASGSLAPGSHAQPYGEEGRVGLLFAAEVQLSLPRSGLYEVRILIDDIEVRRLAFSALEQA